MPVGLVQNRQTLRFHDRQPFQVGEGLLRVSVDACSDSGAAGRSRRTVRIVQFNHGSRAVREGLAEDIGQEASGLWQKILTGPGMTICIIAELAMVFVLSAAIRKLPEGIAYLLFIGYAALNGLTLSVVFIAYELALVQRVFFITAGMFGGMVLYGTFTKSDLSSIGAVCGMALWGLIIALLVNLFLKSSGLDWIVTIAGVVIHEPDGYAFRLVRSS